MSWRDQFKRLKQEWDNTLHGSSQQQYPGQQTQYPGQQQQYYSGQQQYYPQQTPGYQYPPVVQQGPGYPQASGYPQWQPPSQQGYSQPNPPQTYDRPPPPPPSFQQTQQAQQLVAYWQPRFTPDKPVSGEWEHKIGNHGWGNNELEMYTSNPENSFHTNDGKLILRAISNPSTSDPVQKFTSARLVSKQSLSRDRGSLTGVITSPCAAGIWPAFWLLPKEPFKWPDDGEVDIAETWNGDHNNHSCFHWGDYSPEGSKKHRTKDTDIHDMHCRPVHYEWAWDQLGGQAGQGRMIWWIDGRAIMKAEIPAGTRPMRDFTILLNVAMGGNVTQGKEPSQGSYDMVVHHLAMSEEPGNGGWQRFEREWHQAPDGNGG